jgi:hypothetical protein
MATKKHALEMTNEEALKHLFHPKVVAHVKGIVKNANKPAKSKKKATK